MRLARLVNLTAFPLTSGLLIDRTGFALTASLYCLVGAAATTLIALYWRTALWPLDAAANAR
jgi:hypothetical protein